MLAQVGGDLTAHNDVTDRMYPFRTAVHGVVNEAIYKRHGGSGKVMVVQIQYGTTPVTNTLLVGDPNAPSLPCLNVPSRIVVRPV